MSSTTDNIKICKITILNANKSILFLFLALYTASVEEGQCKNLDGYDWGSSDDDTYLFDSKRRTVGKKYTLLPN